MEETGETEVQMASEIVLKSVNETPIGVDLVNDETERDSGGCTIVQNGDKYVTLVTQETGDQIYFYERNGDVIEQAENPEEYIEVCDSNATYEVNNASQEKNLEVIVQTENVQVDDNREQYSDIKLEKNQIFENNIVHKGEHEILSEEINVVNIENITNDKVSNVIDANSFKNYKTVILEDWEVEVPHIKNQEPENFSETVVTTEPQYTELLSTQEITNCNDVECSVVDVANKDQNEVAIVENCPDSNIKNEKENSNASVEEEIIKLMVDPKVDSLKYSKSITKNDIVKILDENKETVVKPIVTGKDLFFSIELTKRLNQKLLQNKNLKNSETGQNNSRSENDSFNNNNTVDDRQKIVDILEADEIKDWKSQPNKSDLNPKENSNDMEISNAIKKMEEINASVKTGTKSQKRTSKKFRMMDKELERSIALQQLREEFPTTRKRGRTMKKVKHIPFLASTVLEKAMTSPEVSTALKPGPPKRRPCYLPDNKTDAKASEDQDIEKKDELQTFTNKTKKRRISNTDLKEAKDPTVINQESAEPDDSAKPNPVVKTYSVKRKSTDVENEIKSTLETIAAVTKALSESATDEVQVKPKKQKTVMKSNFKTKKTVIEKKAKQKTAGAGKRNLELEKLLGDEGAVRMLYDTQHKEANSTCKKARTTTGLKKDLVLKTKLVKNAVMRLSGVSTEGVHLRGKRLSKVPVKVEEKSEPLFVSTPNVVLYKPKKKQRAEASRILYRHSSSESYDSSEGYRRTSFDADADASKDVLTLATDNVEEPQEILTETERVPLKTRVRKSEIFSKKKLNRLQTTKRLSQKGEEKSAKVKGRSDSVSTDSQTPNSSKLNLSNVPVRKSCRPRVVSKKYSIWSSTSMDSLSVEALGLKKLKKASAELGKRLNCKELTILQYDHLVQVILNPVSTLLKNSLSIEVLKELNHVFNFLSEENSCKAVLLSSTGSTFCRGIDISQIISCKESDRKTLVSELTKVIGNFCTCLSDFKKPVIAGVHAAAIGLGVTLLPYCDLVVASDKASFYTPYVKLGQASEGGATYTFPRISRQLVSELLFQSHKMTAADAFKYGLVTRILPEERFEEDLLVLARNIAAQPSQVSK
ncbi:hypothetical protein RUM44_002924 [Polyplax serrata]|uniref:Uncharacterized protein n=1 Tax=Polyplax serrata TaxID=468196 RepID=A0ABR1AX37_POLSC